MYTIGVYIHLLQLFRSELDDCDGDSEGESEGLSIVPSEMTRPIYLGSSVTVLGATILPSSYHLLTCLHTYEC